MGGASELLAPCSRLLLTLAELTPCHLLRESSPHGDPVLQRGGFIAQQDVASARPSLGGPPPAFQGPVGAAFQLCPEETEWVTPGRLSPSI